MQTKLMKSLGSLPSAHLAAVGLCANWQRVRSEIITIGHIYYSFLPFSTTFRWSVAFCCRMIPSEEGL